MKLVLTRKVYTTRSTIGDLTVDGKFLCHILEDPVRPEKIKGLTAITAGTYQIIISWSPRFRQRMPLLENVPGFEGIRIHPGNTPADTEGCLLPGRTRATDRVNASRDAYQELFRLLDAQLTAGRKLALHIVEAGVSPFMKDAITAASKKDHCFLVTADPLGVRSSPDPSGNSNLIGYLPFGTIVAATGKKTPPGWTEVLGSVEEKSTRGFVESRFLEAIPKAVTIPESSLTPDDAAARELHRVAVASLNLRSQAADLRDETILASLARDQLVRKLAATKHPLWWRVAVVVHGNPLEGFLNSSYLAPDGPPNGKLPAVPSTGEVSISEKALQLILEFEGMDQPSRWPGQASGISLGHGYDLGYHTHDDLMGDWGGHLTADHLSQLATAIGKRGSAAKNIASRFRHITITKSAAASVFSHSTVPKIRLWALKTFPGILTLPPDAQGALTSLVYNRGTSMEGERRREMREIRDTVASSALTVSEKTARIAAILRAMKRIWPSKQRASGHPGICRRRDAEAALVEASVTAARLVSRAPAVLAGAIIAEFLDHAFMLAQLRQQLDFLRSVERLARANDDATRSAMRNGGFTLRHITRAKTSLDQAILLHDVAREPGSFFLPQDPFSKTVQDSLTRLSIRSGSIVEIAPPPHAPSPTHRLHQPVEPFLSLATFMELFGFLFATWKSPAAKAPHQR